MRPRTTLLTLGSRWLAAGALLLAAGCVSNEPTALPRFLPVEILTTTLADATVGVPYLATIVAAGGNGAYEFTVIDGALPSGLDLSGGGAIAGQPAMAGASTFQVEVTSGDGQRANRQFTITVLP